MAIAAPEGSVNLSATGMVITTGPEFWPQHRIKNASKDHLYIHVNSLITFLCSIKKKKNRLFSPNFHFIFFLSFIFSFSCVLVSLVFLLIFIIDNLLSFFSLFGFFSQFLFVDTPWFVDVMFLMLHVRFMVLHIWKIYGILELREPLLSSNAVHLSYKRENWISGKILDLHSLHSFLMKNNGTMNFPEFVLLYR